MVVVAKSNGQHRLRCLHCQRFYSGRIESQFCGRSCWYAYRAGRAAENKPRERVPGTISLDELSDLVASGVTKGAPPPDPARALRDAHRDALRGARKIPPVPDHLLGPRPAKKPRGILDGAMPSTRRSGGPKVDDIDVCSHGEVPGDCDVCSYGRAVDAYDAGLFDE